VRCLFAPFPFFFQHVMRSRILFFRTALPAYAPPPYFFFFNGDNISENGLHYSALRLCAGRPAALAGAEADPLPNLYSSLAAGCDSPPHPSIFIVTIRLFFCQNFSGLAILHNRLLQAVSSHSVNHRLFLFSLSTDSIRRFPHFFNANFSRLPYAPRGAVA